MSAQPWYLLYIDRYHLGDSLFLQGLSRSLARGRERLGACVVAHGSGDRAERLLEAEGYFPERREGVLVATGPEEARLVEQAVRVTNKKLVALLTEGLVSAVGLQGRDRGLLQAGADGLTAPRLPWLLSLAAKGIVPVVSALVGDADGGAGQEVEGAALVEALTAGVPAGEVTIVLFTSNNLPGIMEGADPLDRLDSEDPRLGDAYAEPGTARRLAAGGRRLLLTNTARLVGSEGPEGTLVGL